MLWFCMHEESMRKGAGSLEVKHLHVRRVSQYGQR